MAFSIRNKGGIDLIFISSFPDDLQKSRGCPTCKESCATKDGRSFGLQMQADSQKDWMKSIRKTGEHFRTTNCYP